MYWKVSNKAFAVAAFALLLFTAGCSGGGSSSTSATTTTTDTGTTADAGGGAGSSGGTGTALSIAERVSVVDSSSTSAKPGQVKPLNAGFGALAAVDLTGILTDTTADYYTDPQFTFVEERSTETFSTVNEILCMMSQTKYGEMVNQGDYIAQIDVGQCSGNNDNAQSAGQSSQNQSSGSNATEYEFWTVNSYRTDEDSPHVLVFWIHQTEEFGEGTSTDIVIEGKATITASATTAPPYGLFTMNFISYMLNDDGTLSSTWLFKGLLNAVESSSGQVLLQFGMKDNSAFFTGGGGFAQLATLNRSADGSAGSGTVFLEESFGSTNTEQTFNFAFDDTAFLRVDTAGSVAAVCLDRQNFDETIWRYNLYYDENHATPGKRVDINSGFSIEYTDSSSVKQQGWIGFWGLWFPGDVTVPDGATVQKIDWGSDGTTTETPYTVFVSDGKMRKHTRKTVPLDDIAGIPLQWGQTDPSTNLWVEYKVEWDKTAAKFSKIATMDQTNYIWQDITPVEITFTDTDWSFDFWSEALGGSGRLNFARDGAGSITQPVGTDSVIFYLEDIVYPGDADVPTNLACFENCPDPTTINGAQPYFTNTTMEAQPNLSMQDSTAPASADYRQYTYDSANMTLAYSGADADATNTSVVMTDATNSTWGVWTGPMFEPTTTNLAVLECDWDAASTCAWNAWNMAEYYTWETGVDQWNKFTGIQDSSNTFLTFDPPMSVEYQASDSTPKYFLEYGGNGDLWGIPGKCVDEQGVDTDCNDWQNEFIRWVPQFSIEDGKSVVNSLDGTTKYYVKGLEKEQRMKQLSGTCPIAEADLTTYDLPDPQTLWEDPALGAEPDLTGAPSVIAGELQVTL